MAKTIKIITGPTKDQTPTFVGRHKKVHQGFFSPKFDVELLDPMSGSLHAWLHVDTKTGLGLVPEDSENPAAGPEEDSISCEKIM